MAKQKHQIHTSINVTIIPIMCDIKHTLIIPTYEYNTTHRIFTYVTSLEIHEIIILCLPNSWIIHYLVSRYPKETKFKGNI